MVVDAVEMLVGVSEDPVFGPTITLGMGGVQAEAMRDVTWRVAPFDEDEARAHSEAILGMDIRGFTVHDLWIEQASEISSEYYASVILDRSEKKLLAMLSSMGGMDVEEMAETDPDALVRIDGVLRGNPPLSVDDLAPGVHEVAIDARGYEHVLG